MALQGARPEGGLDRRDLRAHDRPRHRRAALRAETVEVHAIHVPVLSPTDVLTSKLLALREHNLDFAPMLEIARSLREQINWDELRRRTDESAYAKPFFTLVEELGLAA